MAGGRLVEADADFAKAAFEVTREPAFRGLFDILGFLTTHPYRALQEAASYSNEGQKGGWAALQLGPRPL